MHNFQLMKVARNPGYPKQMPEVYKE